MRQRDRRFFAHEAGTGRERINLPDCVEDAMADLAIAFHWSVDDCAAFTLRELMQWRERARKRSQPEETHGARS